MKTLARMMEHLYWSNQQIIELLEKGEVQDAGALRLLRHMAIAEKVWLIRLNGGSTLHLTLWESAEQSEVTSTISEVAAIMSDNEQGYRQYVAGLSEEQLDTMVSYTNQQGAPFETSIRDILTHVALHGQYHRGQFNRARVADGQKPLVFDFIYFARL